MQVFSCEIYKKNLRIPILTENILWLLLTLEVSNFLKQKQIHLTQNFQVFDFKIGTKIENSKTSEHGIIGVHWAPGPILEK